MKTSYMIVGHIVEASEDWIVADHYETLMEAIDATIQMRKGATLGITFTIHAELNV